MTSPIPQWQKELFGFNERGIVEYTEHLQFAKCINCGAQIQGKEAKDWMFGHIGCPKPNGEFLRNNVTPEKIRNVIKQELSTLLDRVEDLIKEYDESPDDMAGFEIRIKKAVEFRTKLNALRKKIE